MQNGTALRNIPKLMGQEYKSGDVIPGEVLDRMTPQSLRALVNNQTIEVVGMSAEGGAMNGHLKALSDRQGETIKKLLSQNAVLQQAHDDLAARVAKLEAASGAKSATSRRAARAGKEE